MPIGTNTIAESTLSADTKHALGRRDRDGGHSDHCHPGGTSACRHSKQFSAFRCGRRSCAARAWSWTKLDRRELTKTANAFRRATA